MPADRDRLDPTRDNDQGPWGPCPSLRVESFVSPSILLCAADQTATRHRCAAAENSVAARTWLSATPPTRQRRLPVAARRQTGRHPVRAPPGDARVGFPAAGPAEAPGRRIATGMVTDRGSRRDRRCRTFAAPPLRS
ncbi:hypothetical protein EFE23_26745 [Micromonospora solifontis]|uniref:Uncharacterized protein n=1 Tax=Micromonospora solifontis TaxID=2487138 RepID=A0ABX9W8G2_9ACTN|nr:hypothetical protein EFE23_26745 [Micromonospora solifontis]